MIVSAPPEIPEYLAPLDESLQILLYQLGLTNTVILGLIGLAFSLKSWLDGIKSVQLASGRLAASASVRFTRSGPVSTLVACTVSIVVLAAQAVALWLAYFAGNFVSLVLAMAQEGVDRYDVADPLAVRFNAFAAAWTGSGVAGLFDSSVGAQLVADPVSIGTVVVACLGIVGAYSSAGVGSPSVAWAIFGALPMSLGLGVAVLTLSTHALLSVLPPDGGAVPESELPEVVSSMLTCALYCLAFVAVTKAARISALAWSTRSPG
jgi:hypothetical protein